MNILAQLQRRLAFAALLVVILTAAVYLPALNGGFTNWDDDLYFTANPNVQELSWGSIKRIATTFLVGNYHPLTALSFALEHRGFGLDPRASHALNLGLHLVNTLLVLWLATRLALPVWAAFSAALLFGIHPAHVDAVAWVSGRKDLLAALFVFGSLLSYVSYLRSGRRRGYHLALVLFVLSLLSKATALGLPAILIGLDVLLGRKLNRAAWLEKLPFAGAALVFGTVAVAARHGFQGALQEPDLSLFAHLFIQTHRLVYYFLARIVAPGGERWLYPDYFLTVRLLSPSLWGALGLLAAAAGGLYVFRRCRSLLFGISFFLLALAPVLAVYTLGPSAERFLYLPLFGICFIAGNGVAWLGSRAKGPGFRSGALPALAIVLILAVCAPLTRQRLAIWRDGVTLWTHVLAVFPSVTTSYLLRGEAFLAAGDADRALADLDRVLEKYPQNREAWFHRGMAWIAKGDLEGAARDLSQAIGVDPAYTEAYLNRGNVYLLLGRATEAKADFSAAIGASPTSADAFYNRGSLFLREGDYLRAILDLDRAVALNGRLARAWNNRGVAHLQMGGARQALEDFTRALDIDPRYAGAYVNRARANIGLGHRELARQDLEMLRRLGQPVSPDLLEAVTGATGAPIAPNPAQEQPGPRVRE